MKVRCCSTEAIYLISGRSGLAAEKHRRRAPGEHLAAERCFLVPYGTWSDLRSVRCRWDLSKSCRGDGIRIPTERVARLGPRDTLTITGNRSDRVCCGANNDDRPRRCVRRCHVSQPEGAVDRMHRVRAVPLMTLGVAAHRWTPILLGGVGDTR